jgi:hypothetical protein
MYRKIFAPSKENSSMPLAIPQEWCGRTAEIVALPVGAEDLPQQAPTAQSRRKKREDYGIAT